MKSVYRVNLSMWYFTCEVTAQPGTMSGNYYLNCNYICRYLYPYDEVVIDIPTLQPRQLKVISESITILLLGVGGF